MIHWYSMLNQSLVKQTLKYGLRTRLLTITHTYGSILSSFLLLSMCLVDEHPVSLYSHFNTIPYVILQRFFSPYLLTGKGGWSADALRAAGYSFLHPVSWESKPLMQLFYTTPHPGFFQAPNMCPRIENILGKEWKALVCNPLGTSSHQGLSHHVALSPSCCLAVWTSWAVACQTFCILRATAVHVA